MAIEKGELSINSENILPIIKKWLYSDMDIFVRELVSNAADAVTKLQRLAAIGEAEIPEGESFNIQVILNKEAGTIQFIDNGIGMTDEEVKKYINQIAISGATDFVNQYKDKMDAGSEIIGHFGLGFYSAFMAADKVEIETLSYREGATACKWSCTGGVEFEMGDSPKSSRGTEITLHMNEECKEFLEDYKLRSVLRKYCGFVPVDIYFENTASKKEEEGEEKPVNDKKPLWTKAPGDCTDEEYKKFYHNVFTDFNEPLFWIHLNMDYPFRLKGILYFPKLKHELDSIEGQVKLFCNQVFIADNIKEVIPEFLLLLKGVIDCPDLPLNVSRSFLQNDGNVTKMSKYITNKVADKLTELAGGDREGYNKFWDDINQFIKYGCLREYDFYGKVKSAILYKTTKEEYLTLDEYLSRNEERCGKKMFYATNPQQQAQYIRLLNGEGLDAVLMETRLDTPFMSSVESHEEGLQFCRIDSDISEIMDKAAGEGETGDEKEDNQLVEIFKTGLGDANVTIETAALKSDSVPAVVILPEESRRMQDMSKMFGGMDMPGMQEKGEKLVVNKANPLMKTLVQLSEQGRSEDVSLICKQVYDLAMMSHKPLTGEEMNSFLERSGEILMKLAQ